MFHSGELNIAGAFPLIGQHFVSSGEGAKASLGSPGGKLALVVFGLVVNAWFLKSFLKKCREPDDQRSYV